MKTEIKDGMRLVGRCEMILKDQHGRVKEKRVYLNDITDNRSEEHTSELQSH